MSEETGAMPGEAGAEGDDIDLADWGLGPGGGGSEDPGKILDQAEIDSLLGLQKQEPGAKKSADGIMALISKGGVSTERLPMLEVVCDKFARMVSTTLRNFTSDNCDVALETAYSSRFGDYINSLPLPAMIGVFKAEEWDGFALIDIDSPLIYAIVDVLLGGRQGTPPRRIDGRPYTTIESNIIERLMRLILVDFSAAFESVASVNFRLDKLETNPRFAQITRSVDSTVVARFRIDMGARGGTFNVVIPHSTIEPVRDKLSQMFTGERYGRNSVWETHFSAELARTEMPIEVILGRALIPLGEAMSWKKGSQLVLDVEEDGPVEVLCSGHAMFTGSVGQKNGNVAVMIESRLGK